MPKHFTILDCFDARDAGYARGLMFAIALGDAYIGNVRANGKVPGGAWIGMSARVRRNGATITLSGPCSEYAQMHLSRPVCFNGHASDVRCGYCPEVSK